MDKLIDRLNEMLDEGNMAEKVLDKECDKIKKILEKDFKDMPVNVSYYQDGAGYHIDCVIKP
jgi:hypothetical protein